MGAKCEAERKRHDETKREFARAITDLHVARNTVDRQKIERSKLVLRIRDLEEECEALRNQVAALAKASGGGAVL